MRSDTTYTRGLMAEFLARWYLRFHMYRIVKSRYITGRQTNRAEIDIIARRHNTLIFVEVKYRQTLAQGWDAISAHQASRLRRAAETYIARTGWHGDARFDVMIVCGHRIHWIKNSI